MIVRHQCTTSTARTLGVRFGEMVNPKDFGAVGDGIHDAERAMTAAEAWWSRRAELSS